MTGELGYELNVPATQLPAVYRLLREAAEGLDVVPLGYEALDAMRLEKSFGIWSREFTWAYTPGMSGFDRFVASTSRRSWVATLPSESGTGGRRSAW